MSAHMMHEQVCYIHCNFCNTTLADETYGQLDQALLAAERPGPHRPSHFLFEKILRAIQVSIPGNMFNIVTVRCGRCSCLLSVNLGALAQAFPLQIHNFGSQSERFDLGSSSKYSRNSLMYSMRDDQHKKRQRVPSAYNRFIREEIQRIKANNPDINHKEAFSAAAKNWAHFPHIHFGLSLDGSNKQVKLDEGIGAAGGGKGQGIF